MKQELRSKAKKMKSNQSEILTLKKKIDMAQQSLKLEESLLYRISKINTKRKWDLINQISDIYPISSSQDQKCLTIYGVRFPSNANFTGYQEENIATALGIVSHIVKTISEYLDIPLRYPVVPIGGRSVIIDQVSGVNESK